MVRISKASAKQRAGRAGRLRAGRAIRLYSKAEFENFAENEIPEILRSDPTSSILELYSWGIKDPFKFNWLESPTKESIEHSIELLKMLGAIDEKTSVTELGKRINSIPAEPRLAAMLIKAKEAGCLEEAALATAIIEEKDFLTPQKHSFRENVAYATEGADCCKQSADPDLFLRILAFEDKTAFPLEYSVDNQIMKRILKEKKQLLELI